MHTPPARIPVPSRRSASVLMAAWLAVDLFGTSCAFTVPIDDDRGNDTGAARVIIADPDSADPDPNTQPDPVVPCELLAAASLPVPDTLDAYYRDPVRVRLSEPDPSASIRLLTTAGVSIDGRLSVLDDGTVVQFEPNQPLEPETEYRATAIYCDGTESESWAFTVGSAGAPLACDPGGSAYVLELASARWNTPVGFGGVVPLIVSDSLLIGIFNASDGRIEARVAPGTPTSQDRCQPTTTLPSAELTGPDISLGSTTTMVTYNGSTVTLQDWRVDATILPDCSGIAGGRTRLHLDAREVADVVRLGASETSADTLCTFLTTYESGCTGCDSDGQPYCFAVDVEGITGTALEGTVDCVGAADCHPDCEASTCDDPTAGVCAG